MSEYNLSKSIIDWIDSQPGCHARKVHSAGMDGKGEPDILACMCGRMVVIETKLPKGGQPTDIQRYCLQQWRAAGAVAITATSLDDVEQAIASESEQRPSAGSMPDEESHYSCTSGHCSDDMPGECWAGGVSDD